MNEEMMNVVVDEVKEVVEDVKPENVIDILPAEVPTVPKGKGLAVAITAAVSVGLMVGVPKLAKVIKHKVDAGKAWKEWNKKKDESTFKDDEFDDVSEDDDNKSEDSED